MGWKRLQRVGESWSWLQWAGKVAEGQRWAVRRLVSAGDAGSGWGGSQGVAELETAICIPVGVVPPTPTPGESPGLRGATAQNNITDGQTERRCYLLHIEGEERLRLSVFPVCPGGAQQSKRLKPTLVCPATVEPLAAFQPLYNPLQRPATRPTLSSPLQSSQTSTSFSCDPLQPLQTQLNPLQPSPTLEPFTFSSLLRKCECCRLP